MDEKKEQMWRGMTFMTSLTDPGNHLKDRDRDDTEVSNQLMVPQDNQLIYPPTVTCAHFTMCPPCMYVHVCLCFSHRPVSILRANYKNIMSAGAAL
jgi:hypothetical protein